MFDTINRNFQAILLGLGLQHKTIDKLAEELNLPSSQLLALFNRIIRKSMQYFNTITEKHMENTMISAKESVNEEIKMNPLGGQSLHEELENTVKVGSNISHLYFRIFIIFNAIKIIHVVLQELEIKQKIELEKLKRENLEQYAIKGSEAEWTSVLSNKHSKSLVSIKTGEKRPTFIENDGVLETQKHSKKKKRLSSNI